MDLESAERSPYFPLILKPIFLISSLLIGMFITASLFWGNSVFSSLSNITGHASTLPASVSIIILCISMLINGRSKYSPLIGIPIMIYSLLCLGSVALFDDQLYHTVSQNGYYLYGPPTANSLFCMLCLSIMLWYRRKTYLATISRWIVIVISGGTILGAIATLRVPNLFSHFGIEQSGIGFLAAVALFMMGVANCISESYYLKEQQIT